MSAKTYLTIEERAELIEAYTTDKLNQPPANISDKTLITNYGNEGQKGRLEIEDFDVKSLTDPNFKPDVSETQNDGANDGADQGETQKPPIVTDEQSNEDTTKSQDEQKPPVIEEKPKGKPKTTEKPKPNATSSADTDAVLKQADKNAAKHTADINEYIRLTGKRPFSNWTPEQISEELNAIKLANDAEAQAKLNSSKNAATIQPEIGDDEIRLRHKDGREITVTRHSYDNFISKNQPEWSPIVEVPKELL